MRKSLLAALVMLIVCSGCANWSSVPNGSGDGYDVYRPEPYLLIVRGTLVDGTGATANGKAPKGAADQPNGNEPASSAQEKAIVDQSRVTASGDATSRGDTPAEQFTAKVVYLPNYSQRYRIRTTNFLGKADFEFTITDGWQLTKVSDKSDNTTLANTLLSSLATLAGAATGGAPPKAIKPAGPPGPAFNFNDQFALYKIIFDNKGCVVGLGRLGVNEMRSFDPNTCPPNAMPSEPTSRS